MIFADASALVAIIAREDGWSDLAAELEMADRRLYSAISLWETSAALGRSHRLAAKEARALSDSFLATFEFELVVIGAEEARLAGEAYETYGKGRHPASLNMGDCFAYACAKRNRARLLYKGNDFALTDLA